MVCPGYATNRDLSTNVLHNIHFSSVLYKSTECIVHSTTNRLPPTCPAMPLVELFKSLQVTFRFGPSERFAFDISSLVGHTFYIILVVRAY